MLIVLVIERLIVVVYLWPSIYHIAARSHTLRRERIHPNVTLRILAMNNSYAGLTTNKLGVIGRCCVCVQNLNVGRKPTGKK